jgi:hypothetical protein
MSVNDGGAPAGAPPLDAALALAGRGWPILWLRPQSKLPATAHGVHDATCNPDTIREWAARWPDGNIGVACGTPGPRALDVDDMAAGAHAVTCAAEAGGPVIATARGRVFLFAGTEDGTVGLGFGELRGRGSYIVCPPSTHPSGKQYVWLAEPNGHLPTLPGELVPERAGAGAGDAPPVEHVAPGSMYTYLLDRAVRLARAGERDADVIERALVAAFELKRVPGAAYGGDTRDTRRLAEWAVTSEIADRERRRESGDSPWLLPQRTNGAGPSSAVPDRYAGRWHPSEAMTQLVLATEQPTPWRVPGFVADGTLTILSAEAGMGKSIFLQALCHGIAVGGFVAGIPCVQGIAMYVDGEMGPAMFAGRMRKTGVSECSFDYIDALGLDISITNPYDLGWIAEHIADSGARFVVIDSLRRLAPSKSENDSDDMAPTVAGVAKLARDTDAAIVLVHHKGDGEKFFRGSSAIKDQADALFGMLPVNPDDDNDLRRKITCRGVRGKAPRYAEAPPDLFVVIDYEAGGVVSTDAPPPPAPTISVREALKLAIKVALPAKTKADVAGKLDRRRDDKTFQAAWTELETAREIVENDGVWGVVVPQPLGPWGTTTSREDRDTEGVVVPLTPRDSGTTTSPIPGQTAICACQGWTARMPDDACQKCGGLKP